MLEGCTILVAEDQFLIAIHLQDILEEVGARVHVAATVGEAVTAVRDGVDAAVLDVSLADGDVYPAADILAARGLPFVFHSGHAASEELATRYPEAPALSKPAQERVLIATLQEMLA